MSTPTDTTIKNVPSLDIDCEEKRDSVESKLKHGAKTKPLGSARVDKRPQNQSPVVKVKKPTSSGVKPHRFVKKNFAHPTWCQFNNKFIWGLNKSGYECRDCGLPVSRRFIGDAKKTICGETYDSIDTGFTGQQAQAITKSKVFTVYLPHGAKKSVLLNPVEPLRNVLEKICATRGINMGEFVPEDANGTVVSLDTQLGKITGYEITFTRKDGEPKASPMASPTGSGTVTPSDEDSDKKKGQNIKTKKRKSQKTDSKKFLVVAGSPGPLVYASDSTPSSPAPNISKSSSASPPSPLSTSSSSNATTASTPTPAAPTTTATKSKRITEAYDIGRELGSGAFSVVKEAVHKETGRVVAVKVLDKYEDDDEQTQKFKQEISIISSLQHDNIVQFYELDDDDENFYVAMELVGGGELFDYIIENGTIEENESACIIAQVLKAVEYMHSVGTAHRDLKPENLLFKSEDHKIIKIADFGESKSFKEGNLTTYCGTPDYMAPEIIKGEPYASAVDIWAVGVITYVMLAGFPPFDGENDVEVFASILAVRYDFPSPEWDNISEDGKDFVAAILLEDPSQRLTATQCLNHPWIVNNVPAEMRTNSPRNENHDGNTSDGDSLEETKKDVKSIDLVDAIHDCIRLAEEFQNVHVSELKVMNEVVDVFIKNNKSSDVEKAVFNIYWARIKELQSLIKNGKKKKKK